MLSPMTPPPMTTTEAREGMCVGVTVGPISLGVSSLSVGVSLGNVLSLTLATVYDKRRKVHVTHQSC